MTPPDDRAVAREIRLLRITFWLVAVNAVLFLAAIAGVWMTR